MSGQDVTMEKIGDILTEFGFYLNNPVGVTNVYFYSHPSHDWLIVLVYPKGRWWKWLVSVDDCDDNGGEFNIMVESMDGFAEEFKRALGAIKLGRL